MDRKRFLMVITLLLSIFLLTSCSNKDELDEVGLYPAYTKDKNTKKWGYIDEKGEFKVEPNYELVTEFDNNGLAKVYSNQLVGLINEDGRVILPPEYFEISEVKDGIFTAVGQDGYFIFDKSGLKLFETKDYSAIGESSDELLPVVKKDKEGNTKSGYIDKKGNVVIDPKYSNVWGFKNGRALVKVDEDKHLIIDKEGKELAELPYETVAPDEENEMFIFLNKDKHYGFLNEKGEVAIEPKYSKALPFEDGMAVVSPSDVEDKDKKWGVIDKENNYIIEPKYNSVAYLGEGLFAVTKDKAEVYGEVELTKEAIINKEGKALTDYSYYFVGGVKSPEVKNGYISVYDGEKTFLLDTKGKKAKDLPEIDGKGELEYRGKVIKAAIDDRLGYYTTDGELLWEEDNSYKLLGEGVVKEEKNIPNMLTTIYYPKVENLKNEKVEKQINKKLHKAFVEDVMADFKDVEEGLPLVNVNYDPRRSNDMLIIQKSSYYHNQGAPLGMPMVRTYHIDLNTGEFYELKDIFKKDSNYTEVLDEIIKKQMEEKGTQGELFFVDDYKGIKEDQEFIMFKDYLQIYFYPYEIADYSSGFPAFNIPYEDIMDIIDTQSDAWWAFNSTKSIQGN
ncbi:MAG TPA: WG repeat-containing protein [Tissierellales bacterium]|nr:WG repeat-containing protein [Tissierellales bacterium]